MYDFIVIGSGPAGGLLSYSLHKAGANVLLIEAGKFYRKDTFPRDEGLASAKLYWGGGIELSKSRRTAFLRTRVVGGSSIVFQALFDRFDDDAFDSWKAETGVSWFSLQEMIPYYEKAEQKLAMKTFSEVDMNENAKRFVEACENLDYKWKFLRRGMSDCAIEKGNDCIACLNGCHRDSKQSSLVAFVQKAEKEGLKIVSETFINKIENRNDFVELYGISKNKKVKFKTKNVILSGGAFGTTQLLLNSGFKRKLPALGKYFAGHPQFMSYGFFEDKINAHKGNFQTVASNDPNFRLKGFKIENVFAGPISTAMLFNVFGFQHQQYMKKYAYSACLEIAIRDENVGEINIDKYGNLVVNKDLTDLDRKKVAAGLEVVKNIFIESGAKEVVQSPLHFCLHLMGGSRIGTDKVDSVVNPDFNLWDYKNIFVCDSSVFPNAPGINPSLTIMALAERLAERLIK